jgi:hypothetical protein
MGILLVYDVTDESSFNSIHSSSDFIFLRLIGDKNFAVPRMLNLIS